MLGKGLGYLLLSIVCFVIALLQFMQKGTPLTNSYSFESEEIKEYIKKNVDKKPFFRQGGIALLLVGVMFLLIWIEEVTGLEWVYWMQLGSVPLVIIWAIVSSVKLDKIKKEALKNMREIQKYEHKPNFPSSKYNNKITAESLFIVIIPLIVAIVITLIALYQS